jgi:hypothetical protein
MIVKDEKIRKRHRYTCRTRIIGDSTLANTISLQIPRREYEALFQQGVLRMNPEMTQLVVDLSAVKIVPVDDELLSPHGRGPLNLVVEHSSSSFHSQPRLPLMEVPSLE